MLAKAGTSTQDISLFSTQGVRHKPSSRVLELEMSASEANFVRHTNGFHVTLSGALGEKLPKGLEKVASSSKAHQSSVELGPGAKPFTSEEVSDLNVVLAKSVKAFERFAKANELDCDEWGKALHTLSAELHEKTEDDLSDKLELLADNMKENASDWGEQAKGWKEAFDIDIERDKARLQRHFRESVLSQTSESAPQVDERELDALIGHFSLHNRLRDIAHHRWSDISSRELTGEETLDEKGDPLSFQSAPTYTIEESWLGPEEAFLRPKMQIQFEDEVSPYSPPEPGVPAAFKEDLSSIGSTGDQKPQTAGITLRQPLRNLFKATEDLEAELGKASSIAARKLEKAKQKAKKEFNKNSTCIDDLIDPHTQLDILQSSEEPLQEEIARIWEAARDDWSSLRDALRQSKSWEWATEAGLPEERVQIFDEAWTQYHKTALDISDPTPYLSCLVTEADEQKQTESTHSSGLKTKVTDAVKGAIEYFKPSEDIEEDESDREDSPPITKWIDEDDRILLDTHHRKIDQGLESLRDILKQGRIEWRESFMDMTHDQFSRALVKTLKKQSKAEAKKKGSTRRSHESGSKQQTDTEAASEGTVTRRVVISPPRELLGEDEMIALPSVKTEASVRKDKRKRRKEARRQRPAASSNSNLLEDTSSEAVDSSLQRPEKSEGLPRPDSAAQSQEEEDEYRGRSPPGRQAKLVDVKEKHPALFPDWTVSRSQSGSSRSPSVDLSSRDTDDLEPHGRRMQTFNVHDRRDTDESQSEEEALSDEDDPSASSENGSDDEDEETRPQRPMVVRSEDIIPSPAVVSSEHMGST